MSSTATTPTKAPEIGVAGGSSRRSDLDVAAHFFRTLFFIMAVVALGLVLGAGFYGLSHSNRLYEGVSVAGVEVGGMTRSEARAALRPVLAPITESPVMLVSNDQEFLLDPEAAGISVDLDTTVETAYQFGRQGSVLERTGRWFTAIIDGHESPVRLSYDLESLDATLMTLAPEVTRPAIDAAFRFDSSGEPEIVPELPGYGYDLVATRNLMLDSLRDRSQQPVRIITPIIPATVSFGDLEAGLAQAQTAVDSPLVVDGVERHWGIAPDDIRRIVTVGGEDRRLIVDREAVQAFVESIASATDREARDAAVTVEDGRLSVSPSQAGIRVRVSETSNLIIGALESGQSSVTLQYDTQAPRIEDSVAEAAVAAGEAMLDRGITLSWDGGSQELGRDSLLAALTIRTRPDDEQPFVFGFDDEALGTSLESVIEDVQRPVQEPRLRYVDREVVFAQEGQAGRSVDLEQTVENLTSALLEGDENVDLVVVEEKPSLDVTTVGEISLDDVLAEASTYYGDSSNARRHNVEVAAELESGWLIAPGGQFSYAEFIGAVDEASGFVTGFGIVDDPNSQGVTTAPVIGGGICQVSTTIFQAAFWAGLQIDERYSHPYWIQTYGEPPRGMKGLDAMVNIEESGSLDLKFTNTTGNWIAVVVEADGTTVDVRVLGVDPEWDVDVSQPVIYNEIDPSLETRYTDSPELASGQQLQVEYAQQGFTSEITRVISNADGEVIDTSYVFSTYAPSQNTILRGVGTPEATAVAE
jgi:vancomycin resistance protein YoaR